MINIKIAKKSDVEVLALLGRITYVESHGLFIDDKEDLFKYNNKAFSISKTKLDLADSNNLFYIIYIDDLPVGYAKLVLNKTNDNIASKNNCCLERIYILNEFIPLKIGLKFLNFLEEKAKELLLDTMWLSVYVKNGRAIRFYKKNQFKYLGRLNFLVNGKEYDNIVFSKNIAL
jgi:ribosomal protein S18 acetylase RimI-like enzyme